MACRCFSHSLEATVLILIIRLRNDVFKLAWMRTHTRGGNETGCAENGAVGVAGNVETRCCRLRLASLRQIKRKLKTKKKRQPNTMNENVGTHGHNV